MKKYVIVGMVLVGLLMIGAFGFFYKEAPRKQAKDRVMTTIYPLYELTRHVTGDSVEVELLVPAGQEVHDYEPTAKQIQTLSDAQLVVYLTDSFEHWLPRDLIKKGVCATRGMPLLTEGGVVDPHVWQSPSRMLTMLDTITHELSQRFPDKQAIFEKNSQGYAKQLEALDVAYHHAFDQAKTPYFVTQHPAFSYLAEDYGLTQISVQDMAVDQEVTVYRLNELISEIAAKDIRYLYREDSLSSSLSDTIKRETGVQILTLYSLESLTSEQEKTGLAYLSGMYENLENLRKTTDS